MVAGAILLAGLAWAVGRYLGSRPAPVRGTRTVSVLPPENTTLVTQQSPAVSPNGRLLAFVAIDAAGRSLLHVRALDSAEAAPLADTDGAILPFWSPDSRSLAFFSRGKLKTIPVTGGRSQTLCDAAVPRGGTWSRDGTILFVPSPPQPPHLIPAAGGEAKPVPSLAGTVGVSPFRRSPYFLPDGRHYLYLEYSRDSEERHICVSSLDSKESRRLVKSQTSAAYAPPGYLLFRRDATLMAQRFDASSLALRGDPFPVASDVGFNVITQQTLFSVADDGTLVYVSARNTKTEVAWVGRDGADLAVVGPPGYYNSLSLSPDGKRAAVDQAADSGDMDIWVLDLERLVPSRFTFTPTVEFYPVWSPDGGRIAFSSIRGQPPNLYQKVTSGAASEELLLPSAIPNIPMSWSADGKFLIYGSLDPKSKWDIWALRVSGDRKPFPLVQTPADDVMGNVSPDGRWLAYSSNETGSFEVYVRPFPSGPGKWQVSRDGGFEPRWSSDGKELFYMTAATRLTVVPVRANAPAFEAGAPSALFSSRLTITETQNLWGRYAVSPDGKRFLVNRIPSSFGAVPIQVILDWNSGIQK
jgi:Tol biopolymer transport system component